MECKNCGASVRPGMARCVKCGSTIDWPPQVQAPPQPQAAYPQPPQAYPPQPAAMPQQAVALGPPKSKVAAALFAIFLGCLGIHNFYLGYTGKGIAQVLITVMSFPLMCAGVGFLGILATGIWAFIEFILILTGSIKDPFGRPLV